MKELVSAMAECIGRGESFALATVITSKGSAPRAAGAKMLVRADGTTTGTVGGGMLEAQVQRLAGEMLLTRTAAVEHFEFTGKDAAEMDAICGGQAWVLVEWMDGQDPLLGEIVRGLQSAGAAHRRAWLVSEVPTEARSNIHALVTADGQVVGSLPPELPPAAVAGIRRPALVEAGGNQWMIEPLDDASTAYIFGAGHVSRSLAEFSRAVGFWTVVVDDRAEFANRDRFPTADEIIVPDSFDNMIPRLEIDRSSFLIIVTRGHLQDLNVLAQALKTGAGYIGMIGSRRKCQLIFDELRRQGFSEEDILRTHAPVGLPISAQTPEEIGISIVAEMIQERAKLV